MREELESILGASLFLFLQTFSSVSAMSQQVAAPHTENHGRKSDKSAVQKKTLKKSYPNIKTTNKWWDYTEHIVLGERKWFVRPKEGNFPSCLALVILVGKYI